MKNLIQILLLILLISTISAKKSFAKDHLKKQIISDSMVSTVKTKVVNDVGELDNGINFETPRFVGDLHAKVQINDAETSMKKYGLQNVDDNMELDDKKYKKQSEKKRTATKKTNEKLQSAYETLSKQLDDDIESMDDEQELLKTLLKLSIMKKAAIIHVREMEKNVMVDLKLQDVVLKKIDETQERIYELDELDKVQQSVMVQPLWSVYHGWIVKGRRLRTIFNGIVPFPYVGYYPYHWMGWVQHYYRWSYSYYWPYVYFPFFAYGPYRFFHYFPATVYYASFVSYYDYAYVVTSGTATAQQIENYQDTQKEAEDAQAEGLKDLEDPNITYEELIKEFEDASNELKEINQNQIEQVQEILDTITEGKDIESTNLLGDLDLNKSFEDQQSDGDERTKEAEDEKQNDIKELEKEEEEDQEEKQELDDEIAQLEDELLNDDEFDFEDDEELEDDEEHNLDEEQEDDEEKEEEEQKDEQDQEFGENEEDNYRDEYEENDMFSEEEEEEEEDDPCYEFIDDPEAYKECQEGDQNRGEDGDEMMGGQGHGAGGQGHGGGWLNKKQRKETKAKAKKAIQQLVERARARKQNRLKRHATSSVKKVVNKFFKLRKL